jgi:hypothetical protein
MIQLGESILKRVGILLVVLILQLASTTVTAQEVVEGNQITINHTLSDPLEYHAFCFAEPLQAGVEVYWNFEVTSTETVDFFIMDAENWTIMDDGTGMVNTIYQLIEVTDDYSNIVIPSTDTWYFVFRNPIGHESSVQITGTIVKTSPSSSPTTVPSSNTGNWIDGSLIIVTLLVVSLFVVAYIVHKKMR